MSEPEKPSSPDGIQRGRGSAKVAAGIFLSRIAGLVREGIFANYFGNTASGDAWRAASRLPNVLQNLLGEGTLSASFIPVYAELLEQKRDAEAARFAGAIFGLLALVAGALAFLGIILAPFLVGLIFPLWDAEQQALTTALVRILFPMTAILVLSAWSLGVLNSHRRLFLSYVAPVAWNAAMIGTLLLVGGRWGWREGELAVGLAWGALLGGVLQLAVQLPTVMRLLGEFRPSISLQVEGVRGAIRTFFPALASRGAVNLSGYLDAVLAGLLATGALSAIGYAQILYLLPISLFGASVAAAELPELSRERLHWGEESARVLQKNIMRSLYFLLPSAIAYLAFGNIIIGALFGRGLFGEADILLVWAVLGVYTLGLPASALSRVLSSVFFAQRDTRTPAGIAYARVALSAVVGLLLMFPLDRTGIGGGLRLGAVGLAFGATAGAWLEFTLLFRALKKTAFISPIRNHGLTRVLLAAGVAAAVGLAVDRILPPLQPWLHLLCVLLPFGGVYLGMTYLLRAADPLRELLARRRVGGG